MTEPESRQEPELNRIAKAMFDSEKGRYFPWERMAEEGRDRWRNLARVALSATGVTQDDTVCCMGLDDAGCAATPVRHCEGRRGVTQDVERLREVLFDDGLAHMTIPDEADGHNLFVCRGCILAALADDAALTSAPHDGEGSE